PTQKLAASGSLVRHQRLLAQTKKSSYRFHSPVTSNPKNEITSSVSHSRPGLSRGSVLVNRKYTDAKPNTGNISACINAPVSTSVTGFKREANKTTHTIGMPTQNAEIDVRCADSLLESMTPNSLRLSV